MKLKILFSILITLLLTSSFVASDHHENQNEEIDYSDENAYNDPLIASSMNPNNPNFDWSLVNYEHINYEEVNQDTYNNPNADISQFDPEETNVQMAAESGRLNQLNSDQISANLNDISSSGMNLNGFNNQELSTALSGSLGVNMQITDMGDNPIPMNFNQDGTLSGSFSSFKPAEYPASEYEIEVMDGKVIIKKLGQKEVAQQGPSETNPDDTVTIESDPNSETQPIITKNEDGIDIKGDGIKITGKQKGTYTLDDGSIVEFDNKKGNLELNADGNIKADNAYVSIPNEDNTFDEINGNFVRFEDKNIILFSDENGPSYFKKGETLFSSPMEGGLLVKNNDNLPSEEKLAPYDITGLAISETQIIENNGKTEQRKINLLIGSGGISDENVKIINKEPSDGVTEAIDAYRENSREIITNPKSGNPKDSMDNLKGILGDDVFFGINIEGKLNDEPFFTLSASTGKMQIGDGISYKEGLTDSTEYAEIKYGGTKRIHLDSEENGEIIKFSNKVPSFNLATTKRGYTYLTEDTVANMEMTFTKDNGKITVKDPQNINKEIAEISANGRTVVKGYETSFTDKEGNEILHVNSDYSSRGYAKNGETIDTESPAKVLNFFGDDNYKPFIEGQESASIIYSAKAREKQFWISNTGSIEGKDLRNPLTLGKQALGLDETPELDRQHETKNMGYEMTEEYLLNGGDVTKLEGYLKGEYGVTSDGETIKILDENGQPIESNPNVLKADYETYNDRMNKDTDFDEFGDKNSESYITKQDIINAIKEDYTISAYIEKQELANSGQYSESELESKYREIDYKAGLKYYNLGRDETTGEYQEGINKPGYEIAAEIWSDTLTDGLIDTQGRFVTSPIENTNNNPEIEGTGEFPSDYDGLGGEDYEVYEPSEKYVKPMSELDLIDQDIITKMEELNLGGEGMLEFSQATKDMTYEQIIDPIFKTILDPPTLVFAITTGIGSEYVIAGALGKNLLAATSTVSKSNMVASSRGYNAAARKFATSSDETSQIAVSASDFEKLKTMEGVTFKETSQGTVATLKNPETGKPMQIMKTDDAKILDNNINTRNTVKAVSNGDSEGLVASLKQKLSDSYSNVKDKMKEFGDSISQSKFADGDTPISGTKQTSTLTTENTGLTEIVEPRFSSLRNQAGNAEVRGTGTLKPKDANNQLKAPYQKLKKFNEEQAKSPELQPKIDPDALAGVDAAKKEIQEVIKANRISNPDTEKKLVDNLITVQEEKALALEKVDPQLANAERYDYVFRDLPPNPDKSPGGITINKQVNPAETIDPKKYTHPKESPRPIDAKGNRVEPDFTVQMDKNNVFYVVNSKNQWVLKSKSRKKLLEYLNDKRHDIYWEESHNVFGRK